MHGVGGVAMMKALINAISAVFRWLANRNTPEAIKERRGAENGALRDDVADAVESGDADKINAHLDDLLRCVPLLMIVTVAMTLNCSCVRTRTVYVPDADKVVEYSLNGRPGWWVPHGVFVRMMDKLAEAKGKE